MELRPITYMHNMPGQQQQSQTETDRRIDELTSSVEGLRRQMSVMQNEMQKVTEFLKQFHRERSEVDSSSSVQDLRRHVSDMKSEVLRLEARHKYDKSQWELEKNRMKSEIEEQQRIIGPVPFWLHQSEVMAKGQKLPRANISEPNIDQSIRSSVWCQGVSEYENTKGCIRIKLRKSKSNAVGNNVESQRKTVSRFRAFFRRIFSSNADSREPSIVWPL